MRTLGSGPAEDAERLAVERGVVVATSDAGWLVRYRRGDEVRWALVDSAERVVVGLQADVRRLL